MTADQALRQAIPRLAAAEVESPARDARLLLAHAMGLPVDRLTLHLTDALTMAQRQEFDRSIAARAARQPVAQILGRRLFWGLSFHVTRDTLDPRPETELLVATAVVQPFRRMLDLGTGTGCVLLSCLFDMQRAKGLGVDISRPALVVAAKNARDLGLSDRATFLGSDWFDGVAGSFDLIVSNPPYLAQDEIASLNPEVRDWEPRLALTPGEDGLAAYRTIAQGAGARLVPNGRLLVEIGPTQGQAVARLFAQAGFADIRILPDLDGRDRVVAAVKPGTDAQ